MSLREVHGVDVRTGALAARVAATDGGIAVELDGGGDARGAEELLVAVGRRPRSEGIGLDSVGVEPGAGGFLETDERMRVGGSDWLYAVGDVNGRALFTHMGKYQAWVAAENALGRRGRGGRGSPGPAHGSPSPTPRSRQSASRSSRPGRRGSTRWPIDVATDGTAGASFYGKDTGGTSRLVVDESAGTIVGATFTGFETADFLHAATVAIVAEVPLARLRHAVAAYPTRSEIWLKLLEQYEAG